MRKSLVSLTAGRHWGQTDAYLALGIQQFDALASLGVSDGIVFALLIVAHGIEGGGRRGGAVAVSFVYRGAHSMVGLDVQHREALQ
jgi:hypothetical protein